MIPDRLKKIIFRKLYNDLSHVEIIPFNNSIWFVDRDEKYWYFELQKDGTLWWRYQFFSDFFILFSLERDDYQSILAEWVEEVLNSRVHTTVYEEEFSMAQVEEVLNSRVDTTTSHSGSITYEVEEVLNSKVNTTPFEKTRDYLEVEEVLNSRVNTTAHLFGHLLPEVEEVLNSKVSQAKEGELFDESIIEDVLNSKVNL